MVPRFSTPFARSGRPDLSPNPITQLRAIYFMKYDLSLPRPRPLQPTSKLPPDHAPERLTGKP